MNSERAFTVQALPSSSKALPLPKKPYITINDVKSLDYNTLQNYSVHFGVCSSKKKMKKDYLQNKIIAFLEDSPNSYLMESSPVSDAPNLKDPHHAN